MAGLIVAAPVRTLIAVAAELTGARKSLEFGALIRLAAPLMVRLAVSPGAYEFDPTA
jgi:hypothetical protein